MAGDLPPAPRGEVGVDESAYTRFDRNTVALAEEWLKSAAGSDPSGPRVLFVGPVAPHFRLVAPPRYRRDGVLLFQPRAMGSSLTR